MSRNFDFSVLLHCEGRQKTINTKMLNTITTVFEAIIWGKNLDKTFTEHKYIFTSIMTICSAY